MSNFHLLVFYEVQCPPLLTIKVLHFYTINYPFICNYIFKSLSVHIYGVICGHYADFLERAQRMTHNLLGQGYFVID